MDGQHPFEDVDLNAESRAKRLFVSIEPLPERRIYRIDDRGMETYEEEQASEEKLKFLAQLIHEPEHPEPDNSRATIERSLGLAMDQLTRLKNLSARLGTPESEFRLTQVDAPPPDPLEAENITIAAFQNRQNQLKTSTELFTSALGRLRDNVKHQRSYHEDFKTLRRSRWRLTSPDQDRRADVWNEHINVVPKRLNNTWRPFEIYRMSNGDLSSLMLHLHSSLQLRVEAHDMLRNELSKPYYSSSIRADVGDLYNASSNCYVAHNVGDIHRLWTWITKNQEESIFWSLVKKAAAEEHLETREEEILIPMPNSPTVFTLRALKSKHTVPKSHPKLSSPNDSDSPAAPQQAEKTSNSMDVDGPAPEAAPSAPVAPKKRRRLFLEEARARCRETSAQCDKPVEVGTQSALPYNVADPFSESDFDVSLSQDLVILTLKQAVLISQHGSQLDQTRFPLFPTRRMHVQPIQHTCFAPVIAVTHHFRQLIEVSRMLDDIAFCVSRECHLGPLEFHFEPTSLATLSTLTMTFGALYRSYNINAGTFNVSTLQDIDSPVEFVQHVLQILADYTISSVQRHVDALCGKGTATVLNARCVSFPLGVTHPLKRSSGKGSSSSSAIGSNGDMHHIPIHHATFELPLTSNLGLTPSLHINPHIPGIPSEDAHWPLEQDIWRTLDGDNFAEKLTTLILTSQR